MSVVGRPVSLLILKGCLSINRETVDHLCEKIPLTVLATCVSSLTLRFICGTYF